jgi:hypothetical protein
MLTEPVERKYLRFGSACLADNFTSNFRFRQEHMIRLARCLRIPPELKLDNGAWVNGQEGLLILLRFLAYPTRLLDLEQFFGWELSRLSRIFTYMKRFVYQQHRHRLEDHWAWTVPNLLPQSLEAVRAKKLALHPTRQLDPRTANVALHFDGFRVAVCRPQAQRLQEVDGGEVVHLDIQAQVYSNYTKVHNLLFLVAVSAHGLIVFFDGPHLGKGN